MIIPIGFSCINKVDFNSGFFVSVCFHLSALAIMLGHSSAGFTLATYTHATNKVQEQAAAKMGNLLKQAI